MAFETDLSLVVKWMDSLPSSTRNEKIGSALAMTYSARSAFDSANDLMAGVAPSVSLSADTIDTWTNDRDRLADDIESAVEMADRVRDDGILSFEDEEVDAWYSEVRGGSKVGFTVRAWMLYNSARVILGISEEEHSLSDDVVSTIKDASDVVSEASSELWVEVGEQIEEAARILKELRDSVGNLILVGGGLAAVYYAYKVFSGVRRRS